MKSVSEEALEIINGQRRESYGDARVSFGRLAKLWSPVFGMEVTAKQVCICLIQLKIAREINRSKRDNRVDMIGYVELLDQLSEEENDGNKS